MSASTIDDLLGDAHEQTRLRLLRLWTHRRKVELDMEIEGRLAALRDSPRGPVVAAWADRLGWSDLDTDAFTTLCALQLDPELGLQIGEMQGHYGRAAPTATLLARLMTDAWLAPQLTGALSSAGRLKAQHMVAAWDTAPASDQRICVPEAVLSRLLDGAAPRAAGAQVFAPGAAAATPLDPVARRVQDVAAAKEAPALIVIDGDSLGDAAEWLATACGAAVVALDLALGDADVVRHALRDAALDHQLPLIDARDALRPLTTTSEATGEGQGAAASAAAARRIVRQLTHAVARWPLPCALLVPAGLAEVWWGVDTVVRATLPRVDRVGQVARWADVAGRRAGREVDAERLAKRFPLSPWRIEEAVTRATQRPDLEAGARPALLDTEARVGLRQATGLLARPLESSLDWDDLILPDELRKQLDDVLFFIRQRERVLSDYGLRKWGGTGLHILLSGEPGTGKTTLAALLGKELGRETIAVNLDQVFSKYIGETEKNLVKVFRIAEEARALLLLDEADALLAQRTEVKSANDRFANLSVNVVLQLMEQYDVLSVATTNLDKGLDEASLRRFAFRLKFPRPDPPLRLALFRRMLPARLELDEDVDLEWLAEQCEVSGGHIRHIVRRATALAAARDDRLDLEMLVDAANRELQALGRLPIRL